MRGTVGNVNDVYGGVGITPACAGNSGKYGPKFAQSRDHPRVCGEQLEEYPGVTQINGSPPRVRGTDDPATAGSNA